MRRLLILATAIAVIAACAPGSTTPPDQPHAFGETARSLLAALNHERTSGATCASDHYPPTRTLALERRLVAAAEVHTADMVRNGFFSHTGSDGSSVGQRVTREGYAWRAVGENIAWGQRSVEQVVAAWMESPGHCRAIMDAQFTELGAARAENHWTLVFATPR